MANSGVVDVGKLVLPLSLFSWVLFDWGSLHYTLLCGCLPVFGDENQSELYGLPTTGSTFKRWHRPEILLTRMSEGNGGRDLPLTQFCLGLFGPLQAPTSLCHQGFLRSTKADGDSATMLRIVEIFLCFWVQMARRGGAPLAGMIVIGAIIGGWYAVNNLKVNTDTTQMLDTSLAFQKREQAIRAAFPQIKNELSIIVRAPTRDEADGYASALAEKLATHNETVTSVFSAADHPFFQDNGLLFLSERELEERMTGLTRGAGLIEKLIRDPGIDTLFSTLADNDGLVEKSDLNADTLDRIYAQLSTVMDESLAGRNRPFSWQDVFTEEAAPSGGFLRIVNVTPVTDFSRLQPIKPALKEIRQDISELNEEFHGRTNALVTGSLALRGEELETVTVGIGNSFLLSFVLVSLLLILAFRSIYVSVLTIINLLITLTLTSAYAARFFVELNLVSVAFTVLLVGLGLDFSIHLLLHLQEFRAKGLSLRVALNSTMRDIGGAMALAAPTTALAFFSFLPTSFDGIAQLGAVAGVGVLIAFLVSITFLPSALAVAPAPAPRRKTGTVRKGLSLIDRAAMPIAVAALIIGIGAATLLPQARFDADPMSLRSQNSESVIAFNMLFDDENTVPYRLTRLVSSKDEVKETVALADKLETVRDTRSLLDFVPKDQDIKLELIDFAAGSLAFVLDETPTIRTTPPDGSGIRTLRTQLENTRERTAKSEQRTALLESLKAIEASNDPALLTNLEAQMFRFWPTLVNRLQRQFNADFVEENALPAEVRDRYLSNDGQYRVDLLPAFDVRNPKNLDAYVGEVEAVIPDIGGGAIHSKKAGDIIAKSMIEASLLAFIVISAFLFLFVNKPITIILMLFPLALAAVLTIATGVLVNVPFNYANVIVLPLLMGIGVDSGIHLVMRQEKVRNGKNASVYTTATPRAVLFSALTTVASFGSLMLSEHRGTASMGQLLSIAIGYTLICTLVVLPAVFRFSARHDQK